MKKITGIKSVDLAIEARGQGIVNWNSSTTGEFGKSHSLPKMRNVFYYEQVENTKGEKYGKLRDVADIDMSKAQVYVSQNSIRNALFKDENPYHVELKAEDAPSILQTLTGLIRGYAIADKQNPLMRKSPLMITDFIVKENQIIDLEQNTKATSRDEKNSIFTQTKQGKVMYEGLASISIEELQFISLDSTYGRGATDGMSSQDGQKLASNVSTVIKEYDTKKRDVKVTYGAYKRINSVSKGAEWGLFLNEGAVDILVEVMIDKIQQLQIVKNKGYLVVNKTKVRYNSGLFSEEVVDLPKSEQYAVYYREATKEELDEREIIIKNHEKNKSDRKRADAEQEKRRQEREAKKEE